MFVSPDGVSGWSETSKLIASDAAAGDFFGSSVTVSDNVVVVGAYSESNAGGTDAGY